MDASGEGLCVLEPTRKLYLRQQFLQTESKTLSINIRELRSAVLAVLHWGPKWAEAANRARTHVRFYIDNTTAVSWANRRSSRHPTAQLYNRLLSLAEFQYNLVCTASHIPGNLNVMADAGSRAWSGADSISHTWSNLSASWTQDKIDPQFEDLSALWERCYSATPWHALPTPSTDNIGDNGAHSRG
ncbi:unnamed protein product [Phytophthora fragariaefolia]|uniref:Unnamed protein product n=1 Tax=Phytophthora fragariaefolia TaxID=1490495 RepID=A0A9W6TLL6_9STRA|nr:unnamed protein product [Phytophthora fragariaefolia]